MMIKPTESESLAELHRFCEAMIAIREEIRAIERGTSDRQDNPLKRAPHTADLVLADWTRPYSRDQAFFPLPETRADKYWPRSAAGRQRPRRPPPGVQLPAAGGGTGRRRNKREGAATPPRGLPLEIGRVASMSTIFSRWSSEVLIESIISGVCSRA